MSIPMIYMHNGELMIIMPGRIEKLETLPDLVILLSPIEYPGRYITLKEAMSIRRINYTTDKVETLDKALAICSLFNRVSTALQPYVYAANIDINVSKIWIDGMPPVIDAEGQSEIQEKDLLRAVEIFSNIKYNVSTGRTIDDDLELLKIIYNNATLVDLREVYSRI